MLVSVSGGSDSMALLHLLHRSGGVRIEVAHVDYRLRGRSSAGDRRFVEAACRRLEVPFHRHRVSDPEMKSMRQGGLQGKAREIRFRYFRQLLQERKLHWIATGHQRLDQIETFFLRLFRGAGRGALSAMRIVEETSIFRPLLDRDPEELLAYLRERRLSFRVDESNASDDYDRNRIRHYLLPRIRQHFGESALDGILRAMEILGPEDRFLDRSAGLLFQQAVRSQKGEATLDIPSLLGADLALQRRIVRSLLDPFSDSSSIDLAHVDAALDLSRRSTAGKSLSFRGARILRERDCLRIGPCVDPPVPGPWELPLTGTIRIPEFGTEVRVTRPRRPPARFLPSRMVADTADLQFPIVVRFPIPGDRIDPIGMDGKSRSLGRHLMDRGLGREIRSRTLVVADQTGPIWVPGHVQAHRSRVRPTTSRLVSVQFIPL